MLENNEEVRYQVNRCSRCGSCREVCPVFLQAGSEPWVARARVQLAGAALEGQLPFSRRLGEIMDACLLCRACVAHCPNGVRVDELVLWARAEAARRKGLSPARKVLLRGVLPSRRKLALISRMAALCQRASILKNFRGIKLPVFHPLPFTHLYRPAGLKKPSFTVAYFVGCMTQYVYHQTGQAVLKVLEENNVQVLLAGSGCCGMPALAAGDLKTARLLARRNVENFKKLGADFIVTDCATCGEMLRLYGRLLGDEEAGKLAGRVQDITFFLVHTGGFHEGKVRVPLVVTYHDPCHLKRGQGIYLEPRKILAGIDGLTLVEMPGSDACCGLAGSFGFTHRELSQKILRAKMENIRATGAQAVVTGCPSCRLQLASGLAGEGAALPVFHTVELLALSYGG
ncbi:MAG: glycolate oxidase iron-sulfur subunit [Thermoanaerobacter sp.]|nr:glycolate oxidase iron-sulfur subunit [Thermoanaerobacter sp.]